VLLPFLDAEISTTLETASMRQARVAVARAFNDLPYGVYTIPEIGTIGETESALGKRAAALGAGLLVTLAAS
jgi:pyruvate/2-oxoglutarate dehydrogenase complex dihydrolipoamide dehydrogenase (E3) component